MIKTSAKTTSILAVAIAAIMVLCAVSGAIIYNSSSNNNNGGDSPVIDDPAKVTTLPSSSSDLVTMLSKSGENGNALLVDRLSNNNYTFNGTSYGIKTTNDVAKYLYSLGYTVAGNHLAADIVGNDSQETTIANVDDDNSGYENYGMSSEKEETLDVDDSLAAAKKKKSRTFSEAIEESSSFASLKDLTVRQFTSGSWMTDVENRSLAYYIYFNEFTNKESTVLDAMVGTPFSLDGKLIRTVADADDLAQMFYASGYEVVGTSLVDDSLSILVDNSAPATISNFKSANVDDDALLSKTPILRTVAAGAVASTSGPFYELNDMTVELFVSNNYMMNEVRKAQMSSDLETAAELSNVSSQKASIVAHYINIESRKLVASGFDSDVETMAALDLIVGTPFMTKDNKIAVISDADSLAQFFDSLGITVKDGRATFYIIQQDMMISAPVDGMNAEVAYVILSEKDCRSRCLSLEDIKNAMIEKKESAKAAEQTDSEPQATDEFAGVFIENKEKLIEFLLANGEMNLTDALKLVTYSVDGQEIPVKDENDMVNFLTYMDYGVFGEDGVMIELDKNWNVCKVISIFKDDVAAGDFASSNWASLPSALASYIKTCNMDSSLIECFRGTGFILDGQPVRISEDNILDFCEKYVILSDINGDGVTDSYDACNSVLRNVALG